MPILPLVDFLILLGSGSLAIAGVLKIVALMSHYRPDIFGMSAADWAMGSLVFVMFALALAARTWVKVNEPRLLALRIREAAARGEVLVPEEEEDPLAITALPHEVEERQEREREWLSWAGN